MSGVLGSLVGGSATVATTWVTQRTLGKRELLRAEIKRREALYGEFISECSARLVESFERSLDKARDAVTGVCAAQSHSALRLRCRAHGGGKERYTSWASQYFSANLSVAEPRTLVRSERSRSQRDVQSGG